MHKKINILFIFTFFVTPILSQIPTFYEFGNRHFLDSLQQSPSILAENKDFLLNFYPDWWNNLLFILAFAILAVFSLKFKDEITEIVKSFFVRSHFKQLLQQKSAVFSNLLIFFNVSFFILLSVFLFSYVKKFPSQDVNHINYYIYVFAGISVFYLIKIAVANFLSKIVDLQGFSQIYSLNVRLSNVVGAIFLVFSLFIIFYNPVCNLTCYQSVVWTLVAIYLIRIFNLFREFFGSQFYLFYLILYLCTVEILPIFIVISLLSIH